MARAPSFGEGGIPKYILETQIPLHPPFSKGEVMVLSEVMVSRNRRFPAPSFEKEGQGRIFEFLLWNGWFSVPSFEKGGQGRIFEFLLRNWQFFVPSFEKGGQRRIFEFLLRNGQFFAPSFEKGGLGRIWKFLNTIRN